MVGLHILGTTNCFLIIPEADDAKEAESELSGLSKLQLLRGLSERVCSEDSL